MNDGSGRTHPSREARLQTLSDTVRAFAAATSDYDRLRLLSDGGWLTPVAIHLPIENRVSDEATRAHRHTHVSAPRNSSEQASAPCDRDG